MIGRETNNSGTRVWFHRTWIWSARFPEGAEEFGVENGQKAE